MAPPDTFQKKIKALEMLIDGNEHTAQEIADLLRTTRRNAYYFITQLKEAGFLVPHHHRKYFVHPLSPFFQNLVDNISFSNQEASYLHGLLASAAKDSALAGNLQRKVERFYSLKHTTDVKFQQQMYKNITLLEKAMARKQVVILHDYSSSHSQTVTDRVVEPFMFLGNKEDVRAYELKSRTNKTFKIARIGSVELTEVQWFNDNKHRQVYTDMFLFSGEDLHHIVLRLDRLARNLMIEEYPGSAQMMTENGRGHWLFETDVVKYEGIMRFILGLYDHIEILENQQLRSFVDRRIDAMVRLRKNNKPK